MIVQEIYCVQGNSACILITDASHNIQQSLDVLFCMQKLIVLEKSNNSIWFYCFAPFFSINCPLTGLAFMSWILFKQILALWPHWNILLFGITNLLWWQPESFYFKQLSLAGTHQENVICLILCRNQWTVNVAIITLL